MSAAGDTGRDLGHLRCLIKQDRRHSRVKYTAPETHCSSSRPFILISFNVQVHAASSLVGWFCDIEMYVMMVHDDDDDDDAYSD